MASKGIFTFPNPVNEVSARVVAGGVAVMAALTVALRRPWLIVPIAYGFVARALTGPTLSPLGQLSTRVITPLLPAEPKLIAGPPKRFAQTMGAGMSVTSLLLAFVLRRTTVAYVLIGVLGVFATLESVFSYCIGCKIFGMMMRLGLVPEDVCAECAIPRQHPNPHAGATTSRRPATD